MAVTTFTNEGFWDRTIRVLAGAGFAYAAWLMWPGVVAAIYFVFAVIALSTGLVGWCPLYTVLGVSTTGRKTKA